MLMAEIFLKSGDYYWNSGIFIWKASTVIEGIKEFKPAVHDLFCSKGTDYNSENEQAFVDEAFKNVESQ